MFENLHNGQWHTVIQHAVSQQHVMVALLFAWAAGLLSALSPCVYPLIPITLSVMNPANHQGTAWRGFRLSLAYVSGMALLFCLLGILSASAGHLLGSALQHPWLLCAMAGFFFLMACSLLGLFELSLPVWLSQALSQIGGAGYWGALLMGLVAGLLAAPCSGPVLAVVLSLIAQQGNKTLGVLLMASYALGMGLPFLLLGTFSYAATKVPKSGSWLFAIKRFLAVCILLVAIYYLQLGMPALADVLEIVAISNPLPIASIGLVIAALICWSTRWQARSMQLFVRIASATTLAIGLWLGVLWSNQLQHNGPALTWHVVVQEDPVPERMEQLLQAAGQANQLAMLYFSAKWCSACNMLERTTFAHSETAKLLEKLTRIKVDLTTEHPSSQQLRQRYRVQAVPTIVIVNPHTGNVVQHIFGFISARHFARLLQQSL